MAPEFQLVNESSVAGYLNFMQGAIDTGIGGSAGLLAAYTAEQRSKEIGIRKVLGASVAGITGLLAKDFLKLVLVAIIIASPVAYYFMHQWLENFAFRIPLSIGIFSLAIVASIVIAWLTVSYQAIRAALMNPVKSLKSE